MMERCSVGTMMVTQRWKPCQQTAAPGIQESTLLPTQNVPSSPRCMKTSVADTIGSDCAVCQDVHRGVQAGPPQPDRLGTHQPLPGGGTGCRPQSGPLSRGSPSSIPQHRGRGLITVGLAIPRPLRRSCFPPHGFPSWLCIKGAGGSRGTIITSRRTPGNMYFHRESPGSMRWCCCIEGMAGQ